MFNKAKDTSGKIELDKSKRVNIENDLYARDNEAHFKFEAINLNNVSSFFFLLLLLLFNRYLIKFIR
jgi:hypothetical protein